MQAIFSGNVLTHTKLFFAHHYLEKGLIFAKVICLLVILAFSTTYIDGHDKKAFAAAIHSPTFQDFFHTTTPLANLTQHATAIDGLVADYAFELTALHASTFALTSAASACSDLACLADLQARNQVFASILVPTDTSTCLMEACAEYNAQPAASDSSGVFFDLAPTQLFSLDLLPHPKILNLSTVVAGLQSNSWLTATAAHFTLIAAFQDTDRHALTCVLVADWPLADLFSQGPAAEMVCAVASNTQFVFLVLLTIVVAASLAKPMLESSVAAYRWIYCAGICLKLLWFVWAVLRLGLHSYVRGLETGGLSVARVAELRRLSNLAAAILHALLATLPFELLKLDKRAGNYGQVAHLMSALYGAALSTLSYLALALVLFGCLAAGTFAWLHDFTSANFAAFAPSFLVLDLDLALASDLEKIFYGAAALYRYLLWTYFAAAFVFYFRLVTTHIFADFEPKYYRTISDKLSTINKAIDNFSNEVILRPVTTNEAKKRQVIIWLNYGFHEESGQRLTYSPSLLDIFKDIEKRAVGLSFFSDFHQVRAFLKSIFSIIPKAMMSTAKSVRVVVRVAPPGRLSRGDFELQVFARLNELAQFITSMGLDIEVLVFDEHVQNVFASRIYSIVESSWARVKVTNSQASLRRFCAMMALEDFAPEPDELFSSNILEETDDNL